MRAHATTHTRGSGGRVCGAAPQQSNRKKTRRSRADENSDETWNFFQTGTFLRCTGFCAPTDKCAHREFLSDVGSVPAPRPHHRRAHARRAAPCTRPRACRARSSRTVRACEPRQRPTCSHLQSQVRAARLRRVPRQPQVRQVHRRLNRLEPYPVIQFTHEYTCGALAGGSRRGG